MTAGDMLRQAREAHGLHVAVVAAALKVPTQKLEALENDNIDALPDPVFARALAASVCRALKIDPAPVLAKLPGALRPGLADADRTISTHIRSGAPHQGRSSGGALPSRALMAVVILLLVGAAALFWLPQAVFDQLSGTVSRWMARSESTAASTEPANAASPATAGTVVESVTPPAPAVEPMPPPAAAPIAAAPAPAAPALTAATPGGNVLVFTARADSWITVTEPGGKQVLRRTVQAGETVGVSGTLPLAVVVGRASGIDVQVRGKPFDLAPLAKTGGVARFEVKP
ncbi:helix-turn-helix domain-containing protein [Variovorax sp. RT4R15]|uniref:helix-turn-helix domain-containing protein n=1 Tax=Variovorax sp. RT4R15 TaxID=3443737 RepID=UPI003F457EE0